jgi:hypothetical protein
VGMRDPATRPNGKLLETLKQHALKLKAKDDALAIKDDIIKQLEHKNETIMANSIDRTHGPRNRMIINRIS